MRERDIPMLYGQDHVAEPLRWSGRGILDGDRATGAVQRFAEAVLFEAIERATGSTLHRAGPPGLEGTPRGRHWYIRERLGMGEEPLLQDEVKQDGPHGWSAAVRSVISEVLPAEVRAAGDDHSAVIALVAVAMRWGADVSPEARAAAVRAAQLEPWSLEDAHRQRRTAEFVGLLDAYTPWRRVEVPTEVRAAGWTAKEIAEEAWMDPPRAVRLEDERGNPIAHAQG
jgi:hypothetical protein